MAEVIEDEDLNVKDKKDLLEKISVTSIIKKEPTDAESIAVEEMSETGVKHEANFVITLEKENYEQVEFLDEAEFSNDEDQAVMPLNNRKNADSNIIPTKKLSKKRKCAPKPNLERRVLVSCCVQRLTDTRPEFVTSPDKPDHSTSIMSRLRPRPLPSDPNTAIKKGDTVVVEHKMAEVIEDDDVVVVVVKEEKDLFGNSTIAPIIKEEPTDAESVPDKEMSETGVEGNIAITLEKENYEQVEFLDEAEFSNDVDQTIMPLNNSKTVDSNVIFKKKIRKKRIFAPKPNLEKHVPVSYVQELRDTHPEFVTSPDKLIEHLASIMSRLRPPPLPSDAYTVIKNGDTVVVCNSCGLECNNVVSAANHYQRFHGERYLKCYACGLDYTNTTNLYKHEKRCSSADAGAVLRARGRYLGVKGRGRPYTTHNKFQLYTLPHTTARTERWSCSKCPASFSQRATLEAHENMHRGHRPYTCRHCPAAYTSTHSLRRHMRTHELHKYECDHCGFAANTRPQIIAHLKMHLSDMKSGSNKSPLPQHADKARRLPHACHVCRKRYTKMYHLKRHMKNCHGLIICSPKEFMKELPDLKSGVVMNAQIVLDNDKTPCAIRAATNIKETGRKDTEIFIKVKKEECDIQNDQYTQTKPENNKNPCSNGNQTGAQTKIKKEITDKEHKLDAIVPNDDDPISMKQFLNYLETNVKSCGKVEGTTGQYRTSEKLKTLPKVKVVRNYVPYQNF